MDPDNVRPVQEAVVNPLLEAEKEAEATKQALKRKIAEASVIDFQSKSLPEKLRIDPNDPEDVVSRTNTAYCFPSAGPTFALSIEFILALGSDFSIVMFSRKLQNVKRYMLLNQSCVKSNLKLLKTSVKMLGNSSRPPKAKQRRYIDLYIICTPHHE